MARWVPADLAISGRFVTLAAACVATAGQSAAVHDVVAVPATAEITGATLLDRIHGGWVGMLIGGLEGLPHEFKYREQPRETLPEFTFLEAGARTDDDNDFEWTHLWFMDKEGTTKLPYARLAEIWKANMNTGLWVANKKARELMDQGLVPPGTGSVTHNPHAWYNLSGQFCTESYGLIAPGMPQTAAEIGLHYAHIAVSEEPLQATQYWTSLVSLCMFPQDRTIEATMKLALDAVDPRSCMAEVVADALAAFHAHPDDWKAARQRLDAKWRTQRQWNDNSTPVNGAAVCLALLYGQDDFYRTLQLAMALGYDADCNAATAGTVVGARLGAAGIAALPQFRMPDRYLNKTRPQLPAECTVSEQAATLLRLAERVILANGGERVTLGGQPGYRVRLQPPRLLEPLPERVHGPTLRPEAATAPAGDVVLYDATATSPAAVASQSGGRFELKDGLLQVSTAGNTGYPGILIRGSWDLSGCNRISLELVNRDTKGELPLTVRLDNPDADPGQARGVFVDRVKAVGRAPQVHTVALPPALPNARAINARLRGMRGLPLATTGVVADLDAAHVVAVAVYIKEPRLDWLWGVKRIVAHAGETPPVPEWMRLSAEEFFPFIDVYGQFRHKEWPGKVHSEADLQAARQREAADLAAHPGPGDWGRFGGWASGPRLEATGHFRVEKRDGRWWMVDPEGYLFWSHGPVRVTPSTAMTPLDEREFFFTGLPDADSPFAVFYTTRDELLHPYYVKRNIRRTYDFSAANCYRKYGEGWAETFADLAHVRLRSWGLNTIANGSDKRICLQDRTPYTDRFELKSRPIAGSHDGWWPFRDPFDPSFRAEVQRLMAEHRQEMDDPWCFGFFVDNELSWGGPTDLAAWTLASPADQAAKAAFRDRLRARHGTVASLNAAWGSDYPDWDAFLASTRRPGPGADNDLAEFTLAIADAYFRTVREEFKAAAPHKLYLGCRFAGRGPEFAVRAAAPHCDVLSYNLYARHLDDFRLPAGVDRPVLVGEFHFGALDRGLFHPGLVRLESQEERGRVYVQYVTSALRHPQVVGVHWHQFGDQATTGRFDGENFQVGFVDCCDSPYPETIAGIREVGYRLYEIRAGR